MPIDDRLIPPQTNPPREPAPHIIVPGHRPSAIEVPKIQTNVQPVGRMANPGLGPAQSLVDHVHQGVKTVQAGTGVTITGPPEAPIISASGGSGVTQIVAGTNISVSPPGGTGIVTVSQIGTASAARATWTDSFSFTFSGSTLSQVIGSGGSATVIDNPEGDYDPTTHRFTFPADGLYLFVGSALLTMNANGVRSYQVLLEWVLTSGSTIPGLTVLDKYTGIPSALAATNGELGLTGSLFSLATAGSSIEFAIILRNTNTSAGAVVSGDVQVSVYYFGT